MVKVLLSVFARNSDAMPSPNSKQTGQLDRSPSPAWLFYNQRQCIPIVAYYVLIMKTKCYYVWCIGKTFSVNWWRNTTSSNFHQRLQRQIRKKNIGRDGDAACIQYLMGITRISQTSKGLDLIQGSKSNKIRSGCMYIWERSGRCTPPKYKISFLAIQCRPCLPRDGATEWILRNFRNQNTEWHIFVVHCICC